MYQKEKRKEKKNRAKKERRLEIQDPSLGLIAEIPQSHRFPPQKSRIGNVHLTGGHLELLKRLLKKMRNFYDHGGVGDRKKKEALCEWKSMLFSIISQIQA